MLGLIVGGLGLALGYTQYRDQKKESKRQTQAYESALASARSERSLLEKRLSETVKKDTTSKVRRRSSSPFSRSLLRSDDKMMADMAGMKQSLGA